MVVGNGLVARAFNEFKTDDTVVFFCSGVSDSTCKDEAQFNREHHLLQAVIDREAGKLFVYFSTCSIEDPSMAQSRYVQHKQHMEAVIRNSCDRYYIFRLSNAAGITENKTTILNFLYNAIRDGQSFDLWQHSARNLVDIEDAAAIVRTLISRGLYENTTVNIANEQSYPVPVIVAAIENYLGKKGAYNLVDKGMAYPIPVTQIKTIIEELGIRFDDTYLSRLLEKYYTR